MWQGLKIIKDYKGKPRRELPSDTSLPDELNYFYARFKASNTDTCMRVPAVLGDSVITLSVAEVNKIIKQDPRLPGGLPPGGKGRQQHVCRVDPQHWGPSRVCT